MVVGSAVGQPQGTETGTIGIHSATVQVGQLQRCVTVGQVGVAVVAAPARLRVRQVGVVSNAYLVGGTDLVHLSRAWPSLEEWGRAVFT